MASSSLPVSYLEVYQNWIRDDRDRNKGESTIPITEIVRNLKFDTLLTRSEYQIVKRQETDDEKLLTLFNDYMPGRGEEGFKKVVDWLYQKKYVGANDLVAQRQKLILQMLTEDFANKLNVGKILPHLKETYHFSDSDMKQIMSASPSEAHLVLINIIQRNCPGAFEPFYMCLLKSEQFQLAELIYSPVPNSKLPTVDGYKSGLSKKGHHGTMGGSSPISEHAIKENQKFYKEQIEFYGDVPQTCGVLENLIVETVDVAPDFDKDKIYRNFSKPKGLALIFNMRKFDSGFLKERIGTDVDAKNLNNLLDQLGYRVEIKENQTISEIRSAMMRFAKMKEHKNCDSAVVIILTHGIPGALYCSDNKPIQVNEFVGYLNPVNCPALLNKPKIFIIQACRGGRTDNGLESRDGGEPSQQTIEENIRDWEKADALSMNRVPLEADTLLAFSTTPGFVSWRDEAHGTWFVQGICEIFGRNAKKEEILHLFTEVNKLVSEKLSSCGHVQIPEPCSRLRKKFYFYPGVYNLPELGNESTAKRILEKKSREHHSKLVEVSDCLKSGTIVKSDDASHEVPSLLFYLQLTFYISNAFMDHKKCCLYALALVEVPEDPKCINDENEDKDTPLSILTKTPTFPSTFVDRSFIYSLIHKVDTPEYMDFLLQHIKDKEILNVKNSEGETPLLSNIKRQRSKVVIVLLTHGANVEDRDEMGDTCLEISIKKADLLLVKWLLIFGANPSAKHDIGANALQIAKSLKDVEDKKNNWKQIFECVEVVNNLKVINENPHPLKIETLVDYVQKIAIEEYRKKKKDNNEMVNLLSFDGGGVRMAIMLQLLLAIEEKMKDKGDLISKFHWIAGTGTGAIIAAALCAVPLWQAISYSSAAPELKRVSFEKLQFDYLDGGLIANDPTLDLFNEIQSYNMSMNVQRKHNEIKAIGFVLSIGADRITYDRSSKSVSKYVKPQLVNDSDTKSNFVNLYKELVKENSTYTDENTIKNTRTMFHNLNAPYFRFSKFPSLVDPILEKNSSDLIEVLWDTMDFMNQYCQNDLDWIASLL